MGSATVQPRRDGNVPFIRRASAVLCGVVMFWLFPRLFWDSGLSRDGISALSFLWLAATVPAVVALVGSRDQRTSPDLLRKFDLSAIIIMGAALAGIPWVGGLAEVGHDAHYLLAMAHVTSTMGFAAAPRRGRHTTADLPIIATISGSFIAAYVIVGRPTLVAPGIMLTLVTVMMLITNERTVSQLESLQSESEHRAVHDGLTGLLNRRGFIEDLERRATADSPLAHVDTPGDWLVLVDLVGFKQVNDRFGHGAGDQVLSEAGRRLCEILPESTSIARLASDEFAFAVTGCVPDGLDRTLRRLLTSMSRPYHHNNGTSELSASVGVTSLRPGTGPTELITEADLAISESKKLRTTHVTHFTPLLKEQFESRIDLEARLRTALADREIEFWAQPLVRSNNLQPTGVELLARWRRADGSYESPATFIPVAEETGMVLELGRQALSFAASLLDRWSRDPELKDMRVNVNVAASHLANGLLDDVTAVQPQGDGRLGIEFVESQLLTDHDRARNDELNDTLEEFKRRRYRLVIDDFGTGYSSLSYLWDIPLSAIKIDRSLVTGVEVDRTKAGLLTATVAMARELQVPCVAEGVETADAIAALNNLGVPILQGFGIAVPRPLAETELTLRRLIRAARGAQQELPDINEFARSLDQLNSECRTLVSKSSTIDSVSKFF